MASFQPKLKAAAKRMKELSNKINLCMIFQCSLIAYPLIAANVLVSVVQLHCLQEVILTTTTTF